VLGGHDLVGVLPEGVDHEGDRHEEAAEQDDGGQQIDIAGPEGDHHAGDPQQQANAEEAQPLAAVMPAGSCFDRLVRHLARCPVALPACRTGTRRPGPPEGRPPVVGGAATSVSRGGRHRDAVST
jgi:hypothetical protein